MKDDANSATPSAQHDWFIQSLVNVANVAPLSFGVTLQVSGLLVSGYLVSGKAFFEATGQQIVNGFAQNAKARRPDAQNVRHFRIRLPQRPRPEGPPGPAVRPLAERAFLQH
jgi:hypothetical protein